MKYNTIAMGKDSTIASRFSELTVKGILLTLKMSGFCHNDLKSPIHSKSYPELFERKYPLNSVKLKMHLTSRLRNLLEASHSENWSWWGSE